eukprot:TRINITY_DN26744_c0_g1_i1.p1 TRINITY_DN26744_c0_g1~~TRINITY_DN26744_c0_g1_i1.p1  ORF type:complete len:231 (+),score=49.89 TRINITY_DN26744_c0_g1_i1:43-735(+)
MDVKMHDIKGLKAAEKVRKTGSLNAHTPIVGVSGNSLAEDMHKASNAGMDAYIVKPYPPSSLVEMINIYTEFKTADRPADKRQILVVDDNEDVRSVLVRFLEILEPDAVIQEASNGKDATQMAANNRFDLIFMDLYMGETNGLDTTQEIRLGVNKNTPVVCVSGSTQNETIEQVLQSGMTDFIAKPYEMKDIKSMLGKYKKRRRAAPIAETGELTRVHFARTDLCQLAPR